MFSHAVGSKDSLKVFDILGLEITSFGNNNLTTDSHIVKFSANGWQSGVYFARIEASEIDVQTFSSEKEIIFNKYFFIYIKLHIKYAGLLLSL